MNGAGGELVSLPNVTVSEGHASCLKIGLVHPQMTTIFSLCVMCAFHGKAKVNENTSIMRQKLNVGPTIALRWNRNWLTRFCRLTVNSL